MDEKKLINLFYYKNKFGDELSPYIVEKLSNKKVRFKQPFSLRKLIRNTLTFLHLVITFRKCNYNKLFSFAITPVLFAVGSLLESSSGNCIIWGTGLAQPNKKIRGGKILMTRGYLTKKILEENGLSTKCDICGDPAILMPLLFDPCVNIKYKTGIIPHYSHYADFENDYTNLLDDDKIIINLQTNNVEDIIKKIKSCEIIFSESLHGIIIAHAYGLPAIWFKYKPLTGGEFKFRDYFSSVYKTNYHCYSFTQCLDQNFIIEKQSDYIISPEIIKKIQNALISTFPYK